VTRHAPPTDEWYESEASTRRGMIAEVQRIQRRTRARPLPALALALAITGGLTYWLATRPQPVEAEVVLALTEGALSAKHDGVPVDQLREYVSSVLLPDDKLTALIERRDLYRARHKLGPQYAIDQLREQLDIQIWKNTFVTDQDTVNTEHSARIGLTVTDTDPDRAFELAREIAGVVIQSAADHQQALTKQLVADVAETREALGRRIVDLEHTRAEKLATQTAARARGLDEDKNLVQAIDLERVELDAEQRRIERQLSEIAQSRDELAERIASAGLDMTVEIVEEHRPDRSEHRSFAIAMIAVIVLVGSLLASALVLGAFDARIHDVDDVARLALPVLGHVPGFPGDHVGSLAARGAARARVPSFLRWRAR
jgi:hypothetical protein